MVENGPGNWEILLSFTNKFLKINELNLIV